MSPEPLAASAELEAQVEEVRDFLVTVRGGAPFLSGADGRLLLDWLRDGVPVPLLLASIEAVAEKRRARRARGRLSLSACRKAVEAGRARGADLALGEARPDAVSPPSTGLAALAREAAGQPVPEALRPALEAVVNALDALAGDPRHADVVGRAATQAVTRFHVEAWAAAAPEHEALRARADQELEPLRSALSAPAFAEMREEVARDLVRRRYPVVSARRVWDSLQGPR